MNVQLRLAVAYVGGVQGPGTWLLQSDTGRSECDVTCKLQIEDKQCRRYMPQGNLSAFCQCLFSDPNTVFVRVEFMDHDETTTMQSAM